MKILDSLRNANPFYQLGQLKKALAVMTTGLTARPNNQLAGITYNSLHPQYPFPQKFLYETAYRSDILLLIQVALKREILRRGIELLNVSDLDADSDVVRTGRDYSEDEIADFRAKLKEVNLNGQSMKSVLEEIEDDLNIMDDAYLFFRMRYSFKAGKISDYETVETLRVDPTMMGLVINRQDVPGMNDNGDMLTACPVHRNKLHENKTICPECGKKLYRVYYSHQAGSDMLYYFKWEIVHKQKYRPSKRFGYSPIYTLWQKIATLNAQDRYTLELYEGKRPPKGLLVFNTNNREAVREEWNDVQERQKENPHQLPAMGVESSKGGEGSGVQYIDFMKTFDELQFSQTSLDKRRQVGSVFGVMPVFDGDLSTSSGLNNEGMQITVTNRAVESGQRIHNEILEKVIWAYKLPGLVARLRPSEEQDEMARLERLEKSLAIGQTAVNLGLKARFDSKKDEVIIDDGDLEKPENPFGGPEDSNDSYPPGNEDQEGDSETGSPDTTASNSGSPEGPDSDNGFQFTKALPPNARYLKPGQKPSEGARVITGPKGAQYEVPSGQGSGSDDKKESTPKENTPKEKVTSEDKEPPLSEEELSARIDQLKSELSPELQQKIKENSEKFARGEDSLNEFFDGKRWTRDRVQYHKRIHHKYEVAARKAVPKDGTPKVVFMAGNSSSGKSTAVSNSDMFFKTDNDLVMTDKQGESYIILNSDDIKADLPGNDGGIGAAIVHNESSMINRTLVKKYQSKGLNIIIDGTMKDSEKALNQLGKFRENGYKAGLIHIDTSAENCVERAWIRYKNTGRYVPLEIISKNAPKIDASVAELRNKFDEYRKIDNNGKMPKVLESSTNQDFSSKGEKKDN